MPKPFKLKTEHYLYFVLLVALLLRLFHINYEGLWNDELFTADSANPDRSIGDVIAFIAEFDIHPPLHNVLTNLWSKLFSYNDTSLRVFNVLIGVWGVKSIFDLAKTLFNKKVAWYAIGFSVLNYYLILYSQEVRPYGLLFLLSNYSFYHFIKLIKNGFKLKYSIWYVIITTAMLYTHYFATFIVAAQIFAFFFVAKGQPIKKSAYKYAVTFAIPVLLFLFWVPNILDKLDHDRLDWRDDASLRLLLKYPQDFFNDYILGAASISLILITLFYMIGRKVFKQRFLEKFFDGNRFALTILITWVVVYFSIPFIKSVFYETLMYNRYFMPLVAPIILLLAFYLSKIKKDTIRNGVFVVILGYSLLLLILKPSPYFTSSTTFREITQEAKNIDSDATVWYLSKNPRLFEYYLLQNNFRHTRRQFYFFSKMMDIRKPNSYFVFLDLRLIPKKYENKIPTLEGYEMVYSNILKNKSGKLSTKLIYYKKIDSLSNN